MDKKSKSHEIRDSIGLKKKSTTQENQMGRIKSITPLVCKGSHFTYEERIQLEFYLSGTGKLPKVTNKVMLGTLLQKSP